MFAPSRLALDFPYPVCQPEPLFPTSWECISYLLNGGYWPSSRSYRPSINSLSQEIARNLERVKDDLEENYCLYQADEISNIRSSLESIEKRMKLLDGQNAKDRMAQLSNISVEVSELVTTMKSRFPEKWFEMMDKDNLVEVSVDDNMDDVIFTI